MEENASADGPLQQWLAEQGFPPDNVNALLANGTTALMRASHHGRSAVVHMLIAAGARLATRNADGNNALWFACIANRLDIIDMLIDAGIDIDNRNDNGATPLMYAASAGRDDIVDCLLAHGADTAAETLDGFTALDLAATRESLALLRRASRARLVAETLGTKFEVAQLSS
jgi:thiosulfate/3-mercaptopyruvate sulfurtransferase